jgi:hypothetical protein
MVRLSFSIRDPAPTSRRVAMKTVPATVSLPHAAPERKHTFPD